MCVHWESGHNAIMAESAQRRERANDDWTPNVLLIGLRGSGKSTVGPIIADRLERQFIDLDVVTLWRLRMPTVQRAWAEAGVVRFRQAEADALRDSIESPDRVIAAGGGTPTAPGAEDLIRDATGEGGLFVVYLREEPATLVERLRAANETDDRPSLTGAAPADEVWDVYTDRDPLYRGLASLVIEGSASAEDAAGQIIARLNARIRR